MPTVQVILANAAHQDWEMEHIDPQCSTKGGDLYAASEGSIETWSGRKGSETEKRSIWSETGWARMVFGDVQSLHERTGI